MNGVVGMKLPFASFWTSISSSLYVACLFLGARKKFNYHCLGKQKQNVSTSCLIRFMMRLIAAWSQYFLSSWTVWRTLARSLSLILLSTAKMLVIEIRLRNAPFWAFGVNLTFVPFFSKLSFIARVVYSVRSPPPRTTKSSLSISGLTCWKRVEDKVYYLWTYLVNLFRVQIRVIRHFLDGHVVPVIESQ